jgi:hypothetical protein
LLTALTPRTRATLWATLFQLCTIASLGWVWALILVTSSPLTSPAASRNDLATASLANPQLVKLVPFALAVGYILPAALMGLPSPSVVSNSFQQWALVAWNVYPLLSHVVLKAYLAVFGKNDDAAPRASSEKQAKSPQQSSHLSSIRFATGVTLALSFAVHAAVLGVSISTVLFPNLFSTPYVSQLSPTSLFAPPLAISSGSTVGDGLRSFFLWDQVAGYLAMHLASLVQLQNAARVSKKSFSWVKAIGITTAVSIVAGPGSACLLVSWLRDEMLFGN